MPYVVPESKQPSNQLCSNSGIALSISLVPAAFGQIMRSKYDWFLHTAPQPGCDNRELFWTRGIYIV